MITTAQRERKMIMRARKYRTMSVQTQPQEGSRHQISRAQNHLFRYRAQAIFNTILKHIIIIVSKLLYIPDNRQLKRYGSQQVKSSKRTGATFTRLNSLTMIVKMYFCLQYFMYQMFSGPTFATYINDS